MFIVYFKKIPTYITKMFKCILKQFSVYQKMFNLDLKIVQRISRKYSMCI